MPGYFVTSYHPKSASPRWLKMCGGGTGNSGGTSPSVSCDGLPVSLAAVTEVAAMKSAARNHVIRGLLDIMLTPFRKYGSRPLLDPYGRYRRRRFRYVVAPVNLSHSHSAPVHTFLLVSACRVFPLSSIEVFRCARAAGLLAHRDPYLIPLFLAQMESRPTPGTGDGCPDAGRLDSARVLPLPRAEPAFRCCRAGSLRSQAIRPPVTQTPFAGTVRKTYRPAFPVWTSRRPTYAIHLQRAPNGSALPSGWIPHRCRYSSIQSPLLGYHAVLATEFLWNEFHCYRSLITWRIGRAWSIDGEYGSNCPGGRTAI